MKRGVLGLWGLVFLALAGVLYLRGSRQEADPTPVVVEASGPPLTDKEAWPDTPVVDFTLTDSTGLPFVSKQLSGKVWVASFFFVKCPGFCLNLNHQIASLAKELADVDVQFVSITVDPAQDTPEALAEYAKGFKADPAKWTFLTGDMAEIARVAEQSFKVSAAPSTHTGRLMLVDQQGRVQGAFSYSSPAEMQALARKIRELTSKPAA
jgi:protein SCO1/2/putative membrane protein